MRSQAGMRQAVVLSVVLLGTACATQNSGAPPSAEPALAQPLESQTHDPERAEQIMNRPLDGTSVDTFRNGLAEVQATVSPAQYRQLQSALSWLLFYDVASRGQPERLYRMLDGKTPRQIMSRAHWQDG